MSFCKVWVVVVVVGRAEEASSFYCSLNWDCCICFSFITEQDLARVEKLCKVEFALSLDSEAH